MRSYLTLTFFFLLTGFVFAQQSKTESPGLFKRQVDSLFPGAQNLEWTMKGSRYEVNFIYNNHSVSMTFNKKGRVIKSITEIDYNNLPVAIRNQIKKNYSGYRLLFFLENDRKGKIEYEIEVMKGSKFFILDYSGDGELLSKNAVEKIDIYNFAFP